MFRTRAYSRFLVWCGRIARSRTFSSVIEGRRSDQKMSVKLERLGFGISDVQSAQHDPQAQILRISVYVCVCFIAAKIRDDPVNDIDTR